MSDVIEAEEIESLAVVEQPDQQGVTRYTPEVEETALSHSSTSIMQVDTYYGAGDLGLTDAQQSKLTAAIDADDIDILPTGEIYYAHDQYRRRLNEAVGVGQWSLRPIDAWKNVGNTVVREFALMVNGKFAATGLGEADYHPSNPRSSWATACESAKSIALRRACKEIGIALECWNKRYAETWKSKQAVKVWRAKQGRDKTGEYQWRRRDAEPFYDETKPSSSVGAVSTPEPSGSPIAARTASPQPQNSSSADAPPAGNSNALIRLASLSKKWVFQGTANAFFADVDGKKWKFLGAAVEVGEKALEDGVFVEVEYRIEVDGKFKNKVVVAAAIPSES